MASEGVTVDNEEAPEGVRRPRRPRMAVHAAAEGPDVVSFRGGWGRGRTGPQRRALATRCTGTRSLTRGTAPPHPSAPDYRRGTSTSSRSVPRDSREMASCAFAGCSFGGAIAASLAQSSHALTHLCWSHRRFHAPICDGPPELREAGTTRAFSRDLPTQTSSSTCSAIRQRPGDGGHSPMCPNRPLNQPQGSGGAILGDSC